ncbi:MAG: DEAD/DEAH box helicase [Acidobacteriota bacterium]
MPAWWRALFAAREPAEPELDEIRRLREEYARLDDAALRDTARRATRIPEVLAATAAVASRVLGLQLFDVQLEGARALANGYIVEMQTGEGKTLAAVPAVVWHARSGRGVHVLTANDYLARRDAEWMGEIYRRLGLTVSAVQQDMSPAARTAAYACDVTYATATEVGFDYLRDQLALEPREQVLRPFATAVIDEADSILIDEARIPLVIAGGTAERPAQAIRADAIVRRLAPHAHFTVEQSGRNVQLTPGGAEFIELALSCGNLFDAPNLPLLTAIQDALHARTLLTRDVDYIVQDDAVLSIDESKGRIVRDRRWPGNLQTALEIKEGVSRNRQGRILGSITIENLVNLYPVACGMTGTAATQAAELRQFYDLEVAVIPTNRPVIRIDEPDRWFDTRGGKETVVAAEIRRVHASGRPVLVGTSSVEESERLSRSLFDVPHQVLNARHEEAEAAIVARAGESGVVTISTNMAGRGVDIRLGPGVAELGGLHVIGTNRHESRRIDHQLRGRAGRQGDPGSSQFFVSREDPLMVKYGDVDSSDSPGGGGDPTCDALQRIAEGQSFDLRLFLRKYESLVEGQRLELLERRQGVLTGAHPCGSDLERLVTLTTIDDLWSDYLAAANELRAGTIWFSLAGADPFRDYVRRVHAMFLELTRTIDAEVPARLARSKAFGVDVRRRGATWTYLTTDEPFGSMTERAMRGLARMFRQRAGRPSGAGKPQPG